MKNLSQLKNSQEFRFAVIGGFNTILDFIILFGLTAVGVSSVVANIFSTGVTFISSFILNKKVTFKSGNRTKSELIREMILFTIVTLFGLWVIQPLVILGVTSLTESFITNSAISLFIAKLVATVASLIWNYIFYSRIVFKKEVK